MSGRALAAVAQARAHDDISDMSVETSARPRAGAAEATASSPTGAGVLAPLRAWPAATLAAIQRQALFTVAVCTVITLSLLGIPDHLGQDGWLALAAGRDIAAHGIPYHDYFTHMAYGVRWIDQQWLAQWIMYALARLGGLQLLCVAYVLITGAAFAGAIAAARRLGGEALHVLMLAPVGAFFYLATAVSIRTQGFAYLLFVATLWLLAADARGAAPRRRIYWVAPILVLWANLHGSATLGAGLVGLYGLTLLVKAVRARGLRGLAYARGWSLVALAPLALLATPYGTQIIHYYRTTLFNSQFGKLVTEWRPASSVPALAIPLGIAFVAACVVLLRAQLRARRDHAAGLRAFDVAVLVVLAIGAVTAVRNITWFGLALMVLLPGAITQMRGGRPASLRSAPINRLLALTMVAVTALASVVVLTQPSSWFQSSYPANAVPTLKRLLAINPRAQIYADVRYADWLVWQDPRLFAGRVAYDTSFELLTSSQLAGIADPAARSQAGPHGLLAPYAIWVLYPHNRSEDRVLLKRPGVHVVERNAKVIIATHPVGERPRAGGGSAA